MISIESTAKTVQKAIEDGLSKLNKSIDEVDITILSSGGLFKKARVEITVIENEKPKQPKQENRQESKQEKINTNKDRDQKPLKHGQDNKDSAALPAKDKAKQEPRQEQPKQAQKQEFNKDKSFNKNENGQKSQDKNNKTEKERNERHECAKHNTELSADLNKTSSKPIQRENRKSENNQNNQRQFENRRGGKPFNGDNSEKRESNGVKQSDRPREEDRRERPKTPITDEIAAAATAFVESLLSKMNIEFTLDSTTEGGELCINISCENGALIGYRGETLDSIEYITSLAINKDDDKFYRINVDCNDYRSKRIETLTALARRMAEKAVKTGRKVVLEPMGSSSRKIIHSVLGENDRIITKSEGREPTRRIIIIPKRFNNSKPNQEKGEQDA